MKLYLDDIRTPSDEFMVFRSVDGLTKFIREVLFNDLSDVEVISLDHDLGDGVPSGHDFTKWLLNTAIENQIKGVLNVTFIIHSANPVGAENMNKTLSELIVYCKQKKLQDLIHKLGLSEENLLSTLRSWGHNYAEFHRIPERIIDFLLENPESITEEEI